MRRARTSKVLALGVYDIHDRVHVIGVAHRVQEDDVAARGHLQKVLQPGAGLHVKRLAAHVDERTDRRRTRLQALGVDERLVEIDYLPGAVDAEQMRTRAPPYAGCSPPSHGVPAHQVELAIVQLVLSVRGGELLLGLGHHRIERVLRHAELAEQQRAELAARRRWPLHGSERPCRRYNASIMWEKFYYWGAVPPSCVISVMFCGFV